MALNKYPALPNHILLVEDNPADVEITMEANANGEPELSVMFNAKFEAHRGMAEELEAMRAVWERFREIGE